jgi:hypothetical protein
MSDIEESFEKLFSVLDDEALIEAGKLDDTERYEDEWYRALLRELASRLALNRERLGSWPQEDRRRAFVQGAQWWEFHKTGATMWQSDRDLAEQEATRRLAAREKKST